MSSLIKCWCFFQTLVVFTAIYLIGFASKALRTSTIEVETIDQMHEEFNQLPFVEVTVRHRDCQSDEEVLFSNTWAGTEAGCYHDSRGNDWVDTIAENNAYNNRVPKEAQRTCYPVIARSPIVEDTFSGNKICGRRGGDPFKSVTRANAQN